MIRVLLLTTCLMLGMFIKNELQAQTAYTRFLKTVDTVPEWIPIAYYKVETFNPTTDTFRCVVAVVIDSTTASPVIDLNAGNRNVVVPPGVTQVDSFPIELINDELYDPFEKIAFRMVNFSDPSFQTADNYAEVYILDDDLFSISFIGAGKSVVEEDTTFLLRIALNGLVDGATAVKVNLDLSNATKGTDFNFLDTTISIAPFSYDTFYVPVTIIDDTLVEANEQINFTLTNPTNGAVIAIAAFTITIIDNDLKPSAIIETQLSELKVYPIPCQDYIELKDINLPARWQIFNMQGEVVYNEFLLEYPSRITVQDLPAGMYLLSGSTGDYSVKKTFIKN